MLKAGLGAMSLLLKSGTSTMKKKWYLRNQAGPPEKKHWLAEIQDLVQRYERKIQKLQFWLCIEVFFGYCW